MKQLEMQTPEVSPVAVCGSSSACNFENNYYGDQICVPKK